MKKLVALAIILFPNRIKIWIYNYFFKYKIHKTAKVGLSYINCENVHVGEYGRIGNFCVVNNLELFKIDDFAKIGNSNTITALPRTSKKHFLNEKDRSPKFILGRHAAIVTKHYFDCCNTVSIGEFSILAGTGTALFTHGIDILDCRQKSASISIGKYCMIGARATILKGGNLPDYSILAAGSTLSHYFTDPYTLYSGVPAKPVKSLKEESEYFHRKTGFVP